MWRVEPILAFADNYLWLLIGDNNTAAVVDPGDATPVLHTLDKMGLACAAILTTHHHADHIGGVGDLLAHFPNAEVYAPADERISYTTTLVKENSWVELSFLPAKFRVIEVPGHTSTHIAYYTMDGGNKLFCGDTIFACGCGRLFEGTGEQMHHSLSKLKALPQDTEIYCAHEYTLDNIAFAKWVEPQNEALLAREHDAKSLRDKGIPTVPSLLALECSTNPFLRFDEPTVIETASAHAKKPLQSGAEVFSYIRNWKDTEFD